MQIDLLSEVGLVFGFVFFKHISCPEELASLSGTPCLTLERPEGGDSEGLLNGPRAQGWLGSSI